MSTLTDEREADYGHPLDHHGKAAAIWGILKPDRTVNDATDWQTLWLIDKLVRFSHTFRHADSLRDLAGYAECILMTWDEIERRKFEERGEREAAEARAAINGHPAPDLPEDDWRQER